MFPIAFCHKTAGKITGTITLKGIVNLINDCYEIEKWTKKAQHLKNNPPTESGSMTYDDIKLYFLPQILANAIFDGADKTKEYAKDGSPWCLSEWDDLPLVGCHQLIAVLNMLQTPPVIAALTLSGNGVWAMWRVNPHETQVVNGRAVARHCKSITQFAKHFDSASVGPCQGRTLCHSPYVLFNMDAPFVQVTGVDRNVEPTPRQNKPRKVVPELYRTTCVNNTVRRIRGLTAGGRNKGINATCYSLHKAIGRPSPEDMQAIESACLSVGMTRDELCKITGYRRLRGAI